MFDRESMYAGAYMVLRALQDNLKGSEDAHKEAAESEAEAAAGPESMELFIEAKRFMCEAARSEAMAIALPLSLYGVRAVESGVESIITERKALHEQATLAIAACARRKTVTPGEQKENGESE